MVQRPNTPILLPTQFDEHIVLQTRCEPDVLADLRERSEGRATTAPGVRLRTRAIHEVAVVEVAGTLVDVVEELDLAIQLALAEGSRGVVCDLSAFFEGAGPATVEGAGSVLVEVVASAGRHGRDWPGVPVAVACPDPQVRERLRAHPLGLHLTVTESLFSALTAVLATPAPTVERLRLAPHPTAPRAAREFVTRTLLDWRLGRAIRSATLVVSELVASSSVNSGTEIDLAVTWNLGALRIAVRDRSASLPQERHTQLDLYGRGLSVVAGLSRTYGILPTAEGGKVVWAVLEAPRPRPSTRRVRPQHPIATQVSPLFTDGRGMTEPPLCEGSSQQPT